MKSNFLMIMNMKMIATLMIRNFLKYNSIIVLYLLWLDRFYLCNNIETNQNINNDTLTYLQEKIWHVIKSNNINYANCPDQKNFVSDYKYSLKKNDIIKLGRIKFIVKEINILGKNVQITNEIFKNYKECE